MVFAVAALAVVAVLVVAVMFVMAVVLAIGHGVGERGCGSCRTGW